MIILKAKAFTSLWSDLKSSPEESKHSPCWYVNESQWSGRLPVPDLRMVVVVGISGAACLYWMYPY